MGAVLIPQTVSYVFGLSEPKWVWIPLVIMIEMMVWFMAYRGIKLPNYESVYESVWSMCGWRHMWSNTTL